jgi:hypothetical protein
MMRGLEIKSQRKNAISFIITDISRYVRGKIFDVDNRTSPNNIQNSKQ